MIAQVESAIVAHRYPLDRIAISQVIQSRNPNVKVSEAISWPELLWQLSRNKECDLLLIDLALLSPSSLQLLKQVQLSYQNIKIIAISPHQIQIPSQQLRRSGIQGGICSKDDQQVLNKTLTMVLTNRYWFSRRGDASKQVPTERFDRLSCQEQRVLTRLDQGLMNKHIADELDISPNTAKAHVCSILRKLQVNTRTQAVLAYRQSGHG